MKQPTRFEIMRRNRRERERVLCDADVSAAWDRQREAEVFARRADFVDTSDWLSDTLKQARVKVAANPPIPSDPQPIEQAAWQEPQPRRVLGGLPLRLWRAIARVRGAA